MRAANDLDDADSAQEEWLRHKQATLEQTLLETAAQRLRPLAKVVVNDEIDGPTTTGMTVVQATSLVMHAFAELNLLTEHANRVHAEEFGGGPVFFPEIRHIVASALEMAVFDDESVVPNDSVVLPWIAFAKAWCALDSIALVAHSLSEDFGDTADAETLARSVQDRGLAH